MATVLMILKIIGLVLLGILGFILLLSLIVLFVPVRYRLDGRYKDEADVKVKITYLLHILSVVIRYTDELDLKIRIFGIPLKLKSGKKKATEDKKDSKGDEAPGGSDEADKEGDKKDKDDKAENKAVSTKDKIMKYVEILKRDSTKEAFNAASYRLCKMLKHIKPRMIDIRVTYGLDDPYRIAQILSIYDVFYTYIGNGLKLYPVYGTKTIEADARIRGHIRFAPVLWHLIMVVLNRDCRNFYKALKS